MDLWQVLNHVIPRLFLLRVPIIFGIITLGLPFFARRAARPLLWNLFDVPPGWPVYIVTLTTQALCCSVLMTGFVALRHADRFDLPALWPEALGPGWLAAAVATVGVVPNLWAILADIRRHRGAYYLWIAFALITGFGLLYIASWLTERNLIHITIQPSVFWKGYFNEKSELGAHVLAIIGFGIAFLLYAFLWTQKRSAPTLAYLNIWLSLLCFGLAGLTFFFDAYRVPLMLAIALVLTITAQMRGSDHYFRLDKCESSPAPLPAQIAKNKGPRFIVVAANGGGIQSATWTARVLYGLEAEAREQGLELGSHIALMSGVSGGSVGLLNALAAYNDAGEFDLARLEGALITSGSSSLVDVTRGLIYPDFLATVLPTLSYRLYDRGNFLEKAWVDSAEREIGPNIHHRKPMSSHYELVAKGVRPGAIFNATVVETGERILLGTASVPDSPETGRRFLRDIIPPQRDIEFVTAARLSATFPFVTPAARPDTPDEPGFHIVDGGYYDNYGVTTAVEWLEEALQSSEGVTDVLFLRLHGASTKANADAPKSRGWFFQFLAPLKTMLSVRTSGQKAHGLLQFELLCKRWKARGVNIESVVFEFDRDRTAGDPPLSWHLSPKDRVEIEHDWHRQSPQTTRVLAWLKGLPVQ
ncbi:MAG TPA: patatin-like phospholipase family protein [Bryobacteraceae bacterium]|nr:patatin-like phospholipase family protein [Bryobacteraceae bacterium]